MPHPARDFKYISLSHWTLLLMLFHLAAITLPARAQDLDDVTINGRVADQNGAAIPGAKVSVILIATGAERVVAVGDEGRYRLVELAPGAYTVRVSCAGFAVEERAGVEALAGQNVRLDFTLRPAGVAAVQDVTETNQAAVDTTRTIVGGTVTRTEIESLPVSTRSPLDLIFTLGGVTEEPLSTRDVAEDRNRTNAATTPEEAGSFALSGGAAYSNNITLDGLDNNDDRAARERFQPSLEAIAEVQIITNQFSAEYGRASGGRVNLRTRGGANDLHGRAFYFFRDESLNANSYFNNLRGLKRLPLQQHNPGFTLGGAIKLPAHSKTENGTTARARSRHFFFIADEFDTSLDSTLIDTI